ncbi:TolC family protein [Dactylosporangium sp. AC04546]|uniref:TolC family protein n=1 Tax=Dactylosporangium sp. AC04546 TaxID=2862460 RepID=UPI001EDD3BCF|nr:TolC family protein [Dactylosporangium sp. AC04546]WVK84753.1 TolC family protein [Dactylosporangium sp. AC04546]
MEDALAGIAARLYAAPPEEFVAVRTEEVARARKAKDTALAAAIGKLRKPTLAAWLVNRLSHERPDLIEELLALAEDLRTAQRELRGADLRELSTRRRTLLATLTREATRLAGPDRTTLPSTEVENTLAAALADEEVALAVRAGTLTKALEYTGFGETPRPQLRLVQGGGSPSPAVTLDSAPEPPVQPGKVTAVRSTPSEDERARRAESRRREEERRRAEEDHARAVKQARKELMTALQQLSDAETAKQDAERALAAAEKAITQAEKRVNLAQAALSDLG